MFPSLPDLLTLSDDDIIGDMTASRADNTAVRAGASHSRKAGRQKRRDSYLDWTDPTVLHCSPRFPMRYKKSRLEPATMRYSSPQVSNFHYGIKVIDKNRSSGGLHIDYGPDHQGCR